MINYKRECIICKETVLNMSPDQLARKEGCDAIVFSPLNDQTGSCFDNRLKMTQMYCDRRTETTVTIIYTV